MLDPILELYVEHDWYADHRGRTRPRARAPRPRLVDLAEYKRYQCPPGVEAVKAFGRDRRLPITNAYRG